MKTLDLLVASASAITVLGASSSSALAGTSAYVTAGLLNGGVDKCLQDFKAAATKAGFTEAQEVVMDQDKKAGDFHADQAGSTLHITVRCDPPQGVWSVAVSGVDNEQTFKGFNDFWKASQ